MAAVNNNPFEYWITYDRDAATYEKLMQDVSNFIRSPGDHDIEVSALFTESMFDTLMTQMKAHTPWSSADLDAVRAVWNTDYKNRKIISGFLTDGVLGKKRLTSMPDRVTNTIYDSTLGRNVMRPTVINCYHGADLNELSVWWEQWQEFMFTTTVGTKAPAATAAGGAGTNAVDSTSTSSGSNNGMVQKPIWSMLETIKNAKYPTITVEEEAISKPLQVVTCAIFDAILVHMMNTIAPQSWQPLRQEMCLNLNTKKNEISANILTDVYGEYDVLFLQEVSKAFVDIVNSPTSIGSGSSSSSSSGSGSGSSKDGSRGTASAGGGGASAMSALSSSGSKAVSDSSSAGSSSSNGGDSGTVNVLHRNYHVHAPASIAAGTNSRDQNSVIMLRRHRYRDVRDVTAEVMEDFRALTEAEAQATAAKASGAEEAPAAAAAGKGEHRRVLSSSSSSSRKIAVEDGDLLVLSAHDNVTGFKYLFASFHGDTNGLATIPVLNAVYQHAMHKRPDHRLLFGMDANTYENPSSDQQGVTSFGAYFTSKKLNSCYGRRPNPKNYTTFHARTYLQSQLNKAVSLEERHERGDKNPKDFILFFDSDYTVLWTRKDNTGRHAFIENMIFPTLDFPSDHAITSTLLIEKTVTNAAPQASAFYGSSSSSNFRSIPVDVLEEGTS